jgi:hypothetical protein
MTVSSDDVIGNQIARLGGMASGVTLEEELYARWLRVHLCIHATGPTEAQIEKFWHDYQGEIDL